MSERAFGLPGVRNVALRLIASVLVVGLLIVVIGSSVAFVRYHRQARDLQAVRRGFIGLTRARAYARLGFMRLTGFAMLGKPFADFGLPWPARGDIAIPFPLVTHDVFCGTYAGAIVRFRGDRVASVVETVWQSSCL